jgi:hypothetical protein
MENVDIFLDIWDILQPFSVFYGHLVHFPVSVCCTKKKSGNRGADPSVKYFVNFI